MESKVLLSGHDVNTLSNSLTLIDTLDTLVVRFLSSLVGVSFLEKALATLSEKVEADERGEGGEGQKVTNRFALLGPVPHLTSVTLYFVLTLAQVMGKYEEFEKQVWWVVDNTDFDVDLCVSVFETNIRVLGGKSSLLHSFHPSPSLLHPSLIFLQVCCPRTC